MTKKDYLLDYSVMEYSKKQLIDMMDKTIKHMGLSSRRKYAILQGINYQHILDWFRTERDVKVNYKDAMTIVNSYEKCLGSTPRIYELDEDLMRNTTECIINVASEMDIHLSVSETMNYIVKLYNHIIKYRGSGKLIEPNEALAELILQKHAI